MMTLAKTLMSMEGPQDRRDRRSRPFEKEPSEDFEYPMSTESEIWRRNLKAAMKEAVKEWLDDQFATFGKWSLGAFLAMLVGAAVWIVLTAKGWKPPT